MNIEQAQADHDAEDPEPGEKAGPWMSPERLRLANLANWANTAVHSLRCVATLAREAADGAPGEFACLADYFESATQGVSAIMAMPEVRALIAGQSKSLTEEVDCEVCGTTGHVFAHYDIDGELIYPGGICHACGGKGKIPTGAAKQPIEVEQERWLKNKGGTGR